MEHLLWRGFSQVEINEGKIVSIVEGYGKQGNSLQQVIDYGESVIMPGLIDVHVHLDEPGRTEWEGFVTGTRAAAAGFWGGLVPENAHNTSILEGLLDSGVLGLKSFMCPSGINDFPMTTIDHIKEGLSVLTKYRRPLLVHAELQQDSKSHLELEGNGDPHAYETYLDTRPPSWEEAAIKELVDVAKDTRIGGSLEGAHVHIVHLSDSSASLDLIKEAKRRGDSISVETCPHYLTFSSEEIPDRDTRYKCSPPIRDALNKEKLWAAILFDLPVTWSSGKKHGLTLEQLSLLWSQKPATLAGLESKGAIAVGNHADIVVWQPEVEFDLDDDYPVFLKHPSLSAYIGRRLSGKVFNTFVRGNLVYKDGKHAPSACGVPILAK
ncbi:hypothetical protein TSUD_387010 [Trifolium subterraneum]|uniref:Uncharacterized protein n=1 Tax=Trifolium subterraneum TaxID=3900 RepID=A0A2Z6PE13_TRISU|nr:hypothetical protein TSUD_387010 [Trifolium subterraneum]